MRNRKRNHSKDGRSKDRKTDNILTDRISKLCIVLRVRESENSKRSGFTRAHLENCTGKERHSERSGSRGRIQSEAVEAERHKSSHITISIVLGMEM